MQHCQFNLNKIMYKTALTLASVGALNWGLVALFDFNLVSALFGVDTLLTNAVYLVVAASAIVAVSMAFTTESNTGREDSTDHKPAYANS